MKKTKTLAVVIENGRPVMEVKTAAKNGDIVAYGRDFTNAGYLIQIGRGKISRNKKFLGDRELMYSLPFGYVNYGGGHAI